MTSAKITALSALTAPVLWIYSPDVPGYYYRWCLHPTVVEGSEVQIFERMVQLTRGHGNTMYHNKPAGEIQLPPKDESSSRYPIVYDAQTVVYSDHSEGWWHGMWSETDQQRIIERRGDDYCYFDVTVVDTDNGNPEYSRLWGHIIVRHWLHDNVYQYTESYNHSVYGKFTIEQALDYLYAVEQDWSQTGTRTSYELTAITGDPGSISLLPQFKLREDDYFAGYGSPFPKYVEKGYSMAFMNACDQLARECDNQIANILEVVELFLGSLDPAAAVRSMMNTIKDLPTLWLWFRYAYSTSKSDIEQAIDYQFARKMSMYSWMRFDGFSEDSIEAFGETVNLSFHCSFLARLKPEALLRNTAWQKGALPNEYIVWDMIPLSFVVDWFTGIGDRLEWRSNLRRYLSDYQYSSLFYTTRYSAPLETQGRLTTEAYIREYSSIPLIREGSYFENRGGTRTVTLIKRAADLISIL